MENNKTLYTSFTNLALKVTMSKGMTLKQSKEIVIQKFELHPFEKMIIGLIDDSKLIKKDVTVLLNECISVCEDFGPDRDYVTLNIVLERISKIEATKKGTNEIAFQVLKTFKNKVDEINKQIESPPLFNVLLETRSIIEWVSMFGIYPLIPKHKASKNKPVLLMPPYLGNDNSTAFVRHYLRSVGFKTYKWDLGVNMINSKSLPKLIEKLDEIYEKHQEKVSLVGWSGGGIFAKIIANRHPDKVEQLITIGSPVWGVKNMKTPLVRSMEFLRGKKLRERNDKFIKELEEIPAVPVTCIYTKTDGLLPWKHCMEAETLRKDIKNIEVFGSHCGMGANASVLLTVANSLNTNITGKKPKGILTKVESLFFPKFWEQKGISKFTNLFFS
ncbi:alpha/beta hydrolase [uncultured Polaribacter sp.]|uniref:alpha/beta hydrolase n=1 Tax=uncultured Polaribacter sp. TaxID=174711 RepID=UPI0030D7D069|tara:strand:- start:3572 stop:4732 length:1161 start_codon:yes stop_codon:yes gene_type:complete